MWWAWCCRQPEPGDGEDAACSSHDLEVHASLLRARASVAASNSVDSSANDATTRQPRLRVSFRAVLPDLAEPDATVSQSRESSGSEASGSAGLLSTASVSSQGRRSGGFETLGSVPSLRAARRSAMHVEDVLDGLASSPRRQHSHISQQQPILTDTDVAVDEGDFAASESQGVVYSSWFALLSKSLGSDVGSPAWLLGSAKQIEGA